MGAIGECCCCQITGCESGFDLPKDSKSFSFDTSANHVISKSGTAVFEVSPSDPCCVSGLLDLAATQWSSGLVTARNTVEDFVNAQIWRCVSGTPPPLLLQDFDFRMQWSTAIKMLYKIAFCDVDLTLCAVRDSYGVCGIQATAKLRLNRAFARPTATVMESRKNGTDYLTFGVPTAIDIWLDCFSGSTISAWSTVPVAYPSDGDAAVSDPTCSGGVITSITRTKFLASTTLPSSFTMGPGDTTGYVNYLPVETLAVCTPPAATDTITSTDPCGKDIHYPNWGEGCTGYAPCGGIGGQPMDLIGRSRTVTHSQSQANGFELFNPYADTWTIGIT